jgi:UDP-glucose 4-epimerase
MRLLITGVSGFIGGSIAHFAAERGHEVVGVGRARAGAAASRYRVVPAEGEPALKELVDGFAPDAILHAAGKASVGASIERPREDFDSAVLTWIELLEAVRRSGRRPLLLFPSSAAVYGNPAELPIREDAPARPISPYGFHKLTAELLAEEYASCFGLDIVVVRLFSVFGPAQRRLLVWELFEQLAGPAPEAVIQGTGHETRDFLHVDDVADAALRLLERGLRAPRPAPRRAEIVNVASGEELSVRELAARVKEILGTEKGILCRGLERPGDPRGWRADVTRLTALLSPWRPRSPRATLSACMNGWLAQERERSHR